MGEYKCDLLVPSWALSFFTHAPLEPGKLSFSKANSCVYHNRYQGWCCMLYATVLATYYISESSSGTVVLELAFWPWRSGIASRILPRGWAVTHDDDRSILLCRRVKYQGRVFLADYVGLSGSLESSNFFKKPIRPVSTYALGDPKRTFKTMSNYMHSKEPF